MDDLLWPIVLFCVSKICSVICAGLCGEQNLLALTSNLLIIVGAGYYLFACRAPLGLLAIFMLGLIEAIFAISEQIARVAFCN